MTKEELKKMDDNEVIKKGYCPKCYMELVHQGGCKRCPQGHVDLCG